LRRSSSRNGNTPGKARGSSDDPKDLALAFIGWADEEDLVAGRFRLVAEVSGIGRDLRVEAAGLLTAPVPLQVQKQLAMREEKATPTIGYRPMVALLGIGADDAVLPDPVIQPAVA